jgi:glycine betaine/proline transport system substrate-binding protein
MLKENTIDEIIGNAKKFNNRVVTIAPGARIVSISQEVIADYQLDDYQLMTSSEIAMIAELQNSIARKQPIIITGWRPHSLFATFDLKFLEDTRGHFKADNVYVIFYKGIETSHPVAYNILSNWSIDVKDLEEMMLENETNGTSFEELAKQ